MMIDTHCHILPGVDDGPSTAEGALRMAAAAVKEGMQAVIATPHHATRRYTNTARKIRRRVAALNSRLKKNNIPLQIFPGQEFRLTDAYRAEHRAGRLQTLAGSAYLLVELPSRSIPSCFYEFLAYMKQRGIHPVIAHPERNLDVISNPDQVLAWIEEHGVRLQVTTQSLIGFFGDEVRRTASYLCKKRWIHFIGSDAHNNLKRRFYIKEGHEALERLCGSEYLQTLQHHAAQLIIGGKIGLLHN
ncbi:tyrosine-protein phosphatase [Paenibacillus azoreducens]|uniref:tyrosine-protein phosphatase n=1 Tax=Paenibacillus azoreducens TaxID=116718 RepID=UPI0039F5FF39